MQKLRNLSVKIRLAICIISTIICYLVSFWCLGKLDFKTQSAKDNYDYSKIKEYNGTIQEIDWRYSYWGEIYEYSESSCWLYILLDNGKEIEIEQGHTNPWNKGDRITVYSADEKEYAFTANAIAVGNAGLGWGVLGVLTLGILCVIYILFFGWKGLIAIFLMLGLWDGIAEDLGIGGYI